MEARRDAGDWYRTVKQLAMVRGRYHMTRHWDGLLEYRWLYMDETDDSRQGALVGIDRHINDNLRVGVGYNFTDFSDDLADLDYQNSGWFINIVRKIQAVSGL
jgi:outer membrane protein assembly factor BamA